MLPSCFRQSVQCLCYAGSGGVDPHNLAKDIEAVGFPSLADTYLNSTVSFIVLSCGAFLLLLRKPSNCALVRQQALEGTRHRWQIISPLPTAFRKFKIGPLSDRQVPP